MRKPKIEYYWTQQYGNGVPVVNWRLVGGNGETMCQSTQGFRDKTDAERSVTACTLFLWGYKNPDTELGIAVRSVGPGRKPK